MCNSRDKIKMFRLNIVKFTLVFFYKKKIA